MNNIVLFAQFASADTDNFMADKTEDMVAMCNSTDTYRSLAKYMDTISYGKVHVTSYFPQMQDGVIQPYVLKQEKSGYTDYNQYALEMVQNITVSARLAAAKGSSPFSSLPAGSSHSCCCMA